MIQAGGGGTSLAPQPPERYDQECGYTHRYDEPVKFSRYRTDVMEPDRGPDMTRVTRESRTITPTEECEWLGVYIKKNVTGQKLEGKMNKPGGWRPTGWDRW